MVNHEDKMLGMFAHLSAIITSFIGPLIFFLVKKDSGFVRENARNALNFQILIAIGYVIAYIIGMVFAFSFMFFGPLMMLIGLITPALWIISLIFSIIAGVKANEGETYKYPVTFEFIK